MKKIIRKTFRKARRDVCRYIVSFDTCPMENRKNYGQVAQNILMAVGMSGVALVMMVMAVLLS